MQKPSPVCDWTSYIVYISTFQLWYYIIHPSRHFTCKIIKINTYKGNILFCTYIIISGIINIRKHKLAFLFGLAWAPKTHNSYIQHIITAWNESKSLFIANTVSKETCVLLAYAALNFEPHFVAFFSTSFLCNEPYFETIFW